MRQRLSTALLLAAVAAALTLALPVDAQVPAPPSPAHSQVDETVNLTMEQRHIIKEIIVKDMKIAPPEGQAAKVPIKIGEVVPAGIPLQPMPVEVSAKVPQIKAHSFLVRDDKVVIVDPKDNKVAALIE